MTQSSTKIIRRLAGPQATIFNDKLSDGTRSYKIWGWHLPHYQRAKTELELAGFKVELKLHNGYSFRAARKYQQPRLWVI